MTTCLTHAQSLPFTTPVPSFTLKPRVEKDDRRLAPRAPLLAPSASDATLGRGLRIRSSFDEEDAGCAAPLSKRGRTRSVGDAASGSLAVEIPEWAVRASGEARLEVSPLLLVGAD
eukprot:scaffold52815_cov32-Cyclotella_meneghiniana.AAC.2